MGRVTRAITARFEGPAAVDRAVRHLVDLSIDVESIHVRAEGVKGRITVRQVSRLVRGAVVGSIGGAVLGLGGALLIALGVVPDPHVGFLVGSPLVNVVQGAALGVMLGGVTGIIWGLGNWTVVLDARPRELEGRAIQVSVLPFTGREAAVADALRRAGGELLDTPLPPTEAPAEA